MLRTLVAVTPSEFKLQAESQIKPKPFVSEPPMNYDDVCGFTGLKKKMDRIFKCSKSNLDFLPKEEKSPGVLLFGPPGSGKTYFMLSLALQYKVSSFWLRPSEILSVWEGQTEKNILVVFAAAKKAAEECEAGMAIICIDHADLIHHDREIRNALFKAMGGPESSSKVLWLAAADRPDLFDKTFLYYFTEKVHVPLPDAETRRQKLERRFSVMKMRLEKSFLDELVRGTERFSFRELNSFLEEIRIIQYTKLKSVTHWKKVDGPNGETWEMAKPGDPAAIVSNLKEIYASPIPISRVPVFPKDIRKILNEFGIWPNGEEVKRCRDFDIRYNGHRRDLSARTQHQPPRETCFDCLAGFFF